MTRLMHNILITGGAGFIGSNFIRYLLSLSNQYQIINIDKLTYAGSLDNLSDLPFPDRHIFIQGDILHSELLIDILQKYQIDTIVHFAAESHVDRSILAPAQFIQTNINGTFILLESARKFWLEDAAFPPESCRFHHISTDEVYGTLSSEDPPFSEVTAYAPNSPYSASKASSDHLVRAYFHTYGLPITISNCSNNYGPYQFPEKLIPLIILNAIEGKTLPIYGDGMQIRDWLYVSDHCEAIYKILIDGICGSTYNIGGNNQPSNLQIVQKICDILNNKFPKSPNAPHEKLIQFITDRPGHDRRYAMDITKIENELNWHPQHNLDHGLIKTVDWYTDNTKWLESIRKTKDYQGWMNKNYQQRKEREQ